MGLLPQGASRIHRGTRAGEGRPAGTAQQIPRWRSFGPVGAVADDPHRCLQHEGSGGRSSRPHPARRGWGRSVPARDQRPLRQLVPGDDAGSRSLISWQSHGPHRCRRSRRFPESRAAAEWAAREATLRGLPLRVLHVREPVPEPIAQAPLLGGETLQYWSDKIPRETGEGIRLRHPGLEVVTEQVAGRPADILTERAKDAELLVLGRRGLSGIGGFVIGSVGLAVVAHTERPVVLVHAGEQAGDEHEPDPTGIASAATRYRPVLLGLDVAVVRGSHDNQARTPVHGRVVVGVGEDARQTAAIRFAYEEARLRGVPLDAVRAWRCPAHETTDHPLMVDESARLHQEEAVEALETALRDAPADVEVRRRALEGHARRVLAYLSHDADLLVVGARRREGHHGLQLGRVAHAVLHHSACPVAIVPQYG
ncbi:universal stress protein [Streptomyces sp. NBC_01396]|uniref:universal stress protein n=1 Tax=Streptomyces sp. NBC_01396 TaxID=2903852 RepID=UPI00386EC1DF